MITYHLVPKEEFNSKQEHYLPRMYSKEGFIHTTKQLSIIPEVANRYYKKDSRPYFLLVIDLEKISADWQYDNDPEKLYPHIYGSIPKHAILGCYDMPRSEDGTFLSIKVSVSSF